MKKKCLYAYVIPVSIILVTALSACAPKTVISTGTDRPGTTAPLFQQAENLFKSNRPVEALEAYQKYIALHPQGAKAPTALLKIGTIYTNQKNYPRARDAYERLIRDYSGSPLVTDAQIDRLQTFYYEKRFDEVIRQSKAMRASPLPRRHVVRLLVLQADAYLASGELPNAFSAYLEAAQMADPLQKNEITPEIETVLSLLTPAEIESLPTHGTDRDLQGTLLYYLGTAYANEGDDHQAIDVLRKFVERYPDHQYYPDALILMQILKEQKQYDHFSIGCLLPLSGPYRFYGDKTLQGIELALDRFSRENTAGNFKMIVKDTESNPEKAVAAVKALADQKIAAIIGPITTAREAAVEAENLGIPIITLTQKTDIADIGPFVFQNFITPRMQVTALVRYAIEALGVRNFAVLFPDENYGHIFSALFQEEVSRYGGSITNVEMYQSDQTDFAPQIRHMIREPAITVRKGRGKSLDTVTKPGFDFEALFIPDAPSKTGLILPQLVYHDITHVHLLGTNLWHSAKLVEMAGAYCQGAIITTGFYPENPSPANQTFVRNFIEYFHEQPNYQAAVSYDTANLLIEIMSRQKIRYRSELKDVLLNLQGVDGVTGTITFKPNGEADKRPYLLEIQGSQFVGLEPPY